MFLWFSKGVLQWYNNKLNCSVGHGNAWKCDANNWWTFFHCNKYQTLGGQKSIIVVPSGVKLLNKSNGIGRQEEFEVFSIDKPSNILYSIVSFQLQKSTFMKACQGCRERLSNLKWINVLIKWYWDWTVSFPISSIKAKYIEKPLRR